MYSASDVTQVFIIDIVRLHGVQKKIVSDRDVNFTSKFWKELFAVLAMELAFHTTYHLKIDGNTKRVKYILDDMLRM